jgi:DNA-binding NarL/FixJ family response regulator
MDAILRVLASTQIQVAVINADRPRDGWPDMTIIRRLHLAHPEVTKVLLLDSYDSEVVVNAFRSGVKGLFCFSDYPFRLLCKCIQSVHHGQVWANSEQLQYLIEGITQVPSLRMVNAVGLKLL